MHVRYPIWLRSAQQRPGSNVFATLFALESVARALLATVIPLQALAIVHDARDVSLIYAAVGLTGLVASFIIPWLVDRLNRRWCYSLGVALLIVAPAFLATVTLPGQVLGMLTRVFGAACLSITLSLYILQHINKRDLSVSEPRRLQYSAVAWTVGPAAGVALYGTVGPMWAYAASAAAAAALLGFFWILRLADNPALATATRRPPMPWHSLRRFIAQPRMRLAWLIAFVRSSWWTFFFVYTPIYLVQSGLTDLSGALVISAGNGLLFLTPVYGRLARRYGVRLVLLVTFVAVGVATLVAAIASAHPAVVVTLFLIGALGCVGMDAVGSIPFLRAVRAHERPEMTTVYRTYLDISELAPPALFAVLLTFQPLPSVFVAQAVLMLVSVWWVRYLPRGM